MKARRRKAVIGILFIMAVCIVFWLLWRDEPPPHDSDLRLKRLDIPDEENAFYHLNFPAVLVYEPDYEAAGLRLHDMATGEKWSSEQAKDVLEKNEEILGLADRVVLCEHFVSKKIKYRSTDLTRRHACVIAGQLLSLRARYLFRFGKEKEAFDEAIKVIRLGNMAQGSQDGVHAYLVGRRVKVTGTKTFLSMLEETALKPEVLGQYVEELGEYVSDKEALISTLKSAYANECKIIDALVAGEHEVYGTRSDRKYKIKARPGYFFKPNATKRLYAEFFRFLIDQKASKDYARDYFSSTTPYPREIENAKWFTINKTGKRMVEAMDPAYGKVEYDRFFAQSLYQATQLLVALKCYKMEHGELPDSLNDLVPKYLREVPKDPFDGKNVRYSKKKKMIWFVGHDLTDASGASDSELRRYEGDPVQLLKGATDPTVLIHF